MSEPEGIKEKRERFLRVAYNLSINEAVPLVNINDVARDLGMDPGTARDHTSEAMRIAYYWGNRGHIKSEADGYGLFSLTRKGIDEVEGNNQTPDAGSTFNIYGPVQGSVIGTHNTAELTNSFDFRSIQERIEREGGEDKEELKRALAQVERLLERGEYLDRGALSQFSGAMERHSWFTGAVAQALIGFATQAMG